MNGVPMKQYLDSLALKSSSYQQLSPRCLSIVKHLDRQLMGYLKYDSSSYGNENIGQFCALQMHKVDGHWRMFLADDFPEHLLGLPAFIEALNHVVFDFLSVDLDDALARLRMFERRDVFFNHIDISLSGSKAYLIKPQ
jgi:hypothetical protein